MRTTKNRKWVRNEWNVEKKQRMGKKMKISKDESQVNKYYKYDFIIQIEYGFGTGNKRQEQLLSLGRIEKLNRYVPKGSNEYKSRHTNAVRKLIKINRPKSNFDCYKDLDTTHSMKLH